MRKINFIFTIGLTAVLMLFTSCVKDHPEDPIIPNEEEVITMLTLTLTPIGEGEVVVMSFQDQDGDGGAAPIVRGGTLVTDATYRGVLELFNELETPAGDITTEIKEEAAEHQFFFESTLEGVEVSYDDVDSNGNPIGLATTVMTGDPAAGSITIVLRHEPNKLAAGVSDGNLSNAGGETDIEVIFDVVVQ